MNEASAKLREQAERYRKAAQSMEEVDDTIQAANFRTMATIYDHAADYLWEQPWADPLMRA